MNGLPAEAFAYLGFLIFSEEHQRKGFGSSARHQIEQLIRSWPAVRTVRLGVADSTDVAGFWEKMEFHPTGRILPCQQPHVRAQIIEMEKEIWRYNEA